MQTLLDFLYDAWNGLVDFLYRLLLTLFDMLKDLVLVVFEQILIFVTLLLSGLGQLLSSIDVVSYIDALPSETKYILGAIGFGQSMGLIGVAVSIRLLLNLIPMVRI